MSKLLTGWNLYCITTMVYGAVRKPFVLKDAKVGDFVIDSKGQQKEVERDILITEKVILTTFGGASSPWAWPVYLYSDLTYLEKKARGMQPAPRVRQKIWGHRYNDITDYLFT